MSIAEWLGLTDSHVVNCHGQHRLRPEVCKAFDRMQKAAAIDGVDIQIVSSFRSFEKQQAIWDGKWLGQRTLYSLNGDELEFDALSETERLFSILIWSALPGASRHHWGTDLDVFDKVSIDSSGHKLELVASEYTPDGPCYQLNCWLAENADRFGFYRPYSKYNGGVAPEAWHISFLPEAESIIQQLNLTNLADTIDASNIQGKKLILQNLNEIYRRYTLNGESR